MTEVFPSSLWIADRVDIFPTSGSGDSPITKFLVFAPHENDAIPIADCSDPTGFRTPEECERNAFLTAAAPEMYAALQAALDGNKNWRELAREALAKAGERLPDFAILED